MQKKLNEVPILLTLSTPTAFALAQEKTPDIPMAYFPLDLPGSVRYFLDSLKPRAMIQVETEIWPNIFVEAGRRDIPVLIINGRISDKHFPRYMRYKKALQPVLQSLTAVGVQNERYAERFIALGCPPDRVRITGNTKFDSVITALPAEQLDSFRTSCGIIKDEAPVITFGSTRPGDEALAAECWKAILAQYPNAYMIVAPRHPDRADEIAACFSGVPLLRRSQLKAGVPPNGEKVLLLDTFGELLMAYACADIAVVGGSFYPGVNGHNPLEPAGLGIPTFFGTYMSNFEEAAQALLDANTAIQVETPDNLVACILGLLKDKAQQETMRQNAKEGIAANQGATQRNVELVLRVLGKASPSE
jgi:3-deoxy-D-manno-octulosonic-acid transferase